MTDNGSPSTAAATLAAAAAKRRRTALKRWEELRERVDELSDDELAQVTVGMLAAWELRRGMTAVPDYVFVPAQVYDGLLQLALARNVSTSDIAEALLRYTLAALGVTP